MHRGRDRSASMLRGHCSLRIGTAMMAAAGMPPGTYALGGQEVIVDDTSARLVDGTLAGSLLTMDQAVRNMGGDTGALTMASETPARLLGLTNLGTIRQGADAD